MSDSYKEVYFNQYCILCKHKACSEETEPCSECLTNPVNACSHKPVKYEEK